MDIILEHYMIALNSSLFNPKKFVYILEAFH